MDTSLRFGEALLNRVPWEEARRRLSAPFADILPPDWTTFR